MKKNNKGFTLAELLIVVAIIAVLVAVAIPVFSAQLEKSREATDLANARSAYAELLAAAMLEDGDSLKDTDVIKYTAPAEGSTVWTAVVTLKQTENDWQTKNPDPETAVAGITATGKPDKGGKCTITYNSAAAAGDPDVTIVYSGAGAGS